MKKLALPLAIGAVSIALFQNCADAGGFKVMRMASTNSSLSQAPVDSQTDPIITIDPTPAPMKDVLGELNFSDIAKVELIGKLDAVTAVSVQAKIMVTLNSIAQTFAGMANFTVAGLEPASCNVQGSNADFSALESGLKSMTFLTDVQKNSTADIASATLNITSKDGTVKSIRVNTSTTGQFGADVDVNAIQLVQTLLALSASGTCASTINELTKTFVEQFGSLIPGGLPQIPGFNFP